MDFKKTSWSFDLVGSQKCCTSINFAVLFHKPIIFITKDILKNSWDGLYIDLMATQFGKTPINIDDMQSINWEKELLINEKTYEDYKNSYIKKAGSDELPFWQIFANHIKNILFIRHEPERRLVKNTWKTEFAFNAMIEGTYNE
jgi:hypothetical protein